MIVGFQYSRLVARNLSCCSQNAITRLMSSDSFQKQGDFDMIVRRFPRRFVKKKLSDDSQRRKARKKQIDEMNQVTLLPSHSKETQEEISFQVPYPREIVKYLDKFVIGQELAKRTLAVGVYQHYKRLENNAEIRAKKLSDDSERRKARKKQIDEMNQVTLLPSHSKETQYEISFQVPYPREIVKYLDKFVIGQELAKRTLAVGVYQHYKRLENNAEIRAKELLKEAADACLHAKENKKSKENDETLDELFDVVEPPPPKRKTTFERLKDEAPLTMDKSNIVLLGPSGSGKTYLTQCLARLLDVPIAMCDCTTLTQAGYVGEDVETVIQKLLHNAHGNIDRTQHGIVFLDEFDKIHSSSDPIHSVGNRDVSGRGVQQALLKLVEGTVAKVKMPGQLGNKVEIDTTNILFIASGAFSSLDQIVARRMDKRILGFGATSTNASEDLSSEDESVAAEKRNELLNHVDACDLMKFGMVPELVGRFPVLVPFHSLDQKMLMRVLQEPRNNLISQAQRLFAMDRIKLRFTRSAINEMARMAARRKTGARALRSILENVLLRAKFECPGTGIQTVVITGGTVRGDTDYVTLSSPSRNDSCSIVPTDSM
ncbi:hypothetical protein Q1695_009769 [Nippostrongylus brasiliensis]|nr:hypothetical protein Q1695_009769 [Nippostrongylus brasiliensis]